MLDTFLIILENFNRTNDEITYYRIKNQTFIGNILFIAKLYNNNIISIEIINKICKDIFDKVKENSKNCELIEYLLQMLQCIEKYDNLPMVINQLNEIKDTLPTRMKFLIMNYTENINKKQENTTQVVETKQVITKSKETYSNLIMEYIINESISDFMNSIKEKVEGEIVISILRKYSPVSEQKLLKFVQILQEKNILTKNQLNDKLVEYMESGDINDIAEECPVILKFIEKLKNM